MCGRYFIEISDAEQLEMEKLLSQLNEKQKTEEQIQMDIEIPTAGLGYKTGEIFPTNIVPIRLRNRMELMKWGFPHFKGSGVIINAKSETVTQKPMFRKAFHERRCLVPASYYFEWEKHDSGKVLTLPTVFIYEKANQTHLDNQIASLSRMRQGARHATICRRDTSVQTIFGDGRP